VGFDVVYSGIRLTVEEIVNSAIEENADVVGVSILSGSHLAIAEQLMEQLREAGAGDQIPVIVGGIIPKDDFEPLRELGVKAVFTPQDYSLTDVMERIMNVVEGESHAAA
jgi:(2R)-ethylmalonyl-CoA mutase